MQRPYEALADLLNCRPENIAIVTSATVGWQQVSCRHRPPAHLPRWRRCSLPSVILLLQQCAV